MEEKNDELITLVSTIDVILEEMVKESGMTPLNVAAVVLARIMRMSMEYGVEDQLGKLMEGAIQENLMQKPPESATLQ